MNEMMSYAASLTGATGKALSAETITVGPKLLVKVAEEKPANHDKLENASSKLKKEELQEAGSPKKVPLRSLFNRAFSTFMLSECK